MPKPRRNAARSGRREARIARPRLAAGLDVLRPRSVSADARPVDAGVRAPRAQPAALRSLPPAHPGAPCRAARLRHGKAAGAARLIRGDCGSAVEVLAKLPRQIIRVPRDAGSVRSAQASQVHLRHDAPPPRGRVVGESAPVCRTAEQADPPGILPRHVFPDRFVEREPDQFAVEKGPGRRGLIRKTTAQRPQDRRSFRNGGATRGDRTTRD